MPGAEWGPAWVDWRYGGGHAGWAPMPPEWGPQHDSYRTAKSQPEARAWIFVSESSFVEADVGRHRAPAAGNADLLAASDRVTNYASVDGRIVNRSIDVGRIAAAARITIAPVRVGSARTPAEQTAAGAQGHVAIYRPVVLTRSQLGAGLPATLDLNLPADNRPAELDSEALAKAQQKLDAKALPDQSSSGGSFETGAGGTIGSRSCPARTVERLEWWPRRGCSRRRRPARRQVMPAQAGGAVSRKAAARIATAAAATDSTTAKSTTNQ